MDRLATTASTGSHANKNAPPRPTREGAAQGWSDPRDGVLTPVAHNVPSSGSAGTTTGASTGTLSGMRFRPNPARWWYWTLLAVSIWGVEWLRVVPKGSYVVHVTIGRVFASFVVEVVLIGVTMFRAGVLFAERRRLLGKANLFLGDYMPRPKGQ
jgi:hypothetical protein